jgi:hypothetical protein
MKWRSPNFSPARFASAASPNWSRRRSERADRAVCCANPPDLEKALIDEDARRLARELFQK